MIIYDIDDFQNMVQLKPIYLVYDSMRKKYELTNIQHID